MDPYKTHVVADLTRPIIGIDNRSGLEAFDIMVDRIKGAASSGRLAALSPQREGTGEGVSAEEAFYAESCVVERAPECSQVVTIEGFHRALGRLFPAPTEGVAAADRIAALESALRTMTAECETFARLVRPDALRHEVLENIATARAALSDGGDHAR